MTLKTKTPTKRQTPDSLLGFGSVGKADARELLAVEIAARDAQWLELVGPVVEAADRLLKSLAPHSFEAKTIVEAATRLMEAKADTLAALRAITEEQQ